MVVNGGGQGLSSWVPGVSTSEEEEEEEAASELMLLGTLLAYWSSLATLWGCVQVKINKFRLIPRLPCSEMQTLKLCRWRLTKLIYDKAVFLKLSKMNSYTFCFLGFFLGDDITSVGSGFITLPRWLCVPSPPGLRGVLLNVGVWSLVGVVTAWPIILCPCCLEVLLWVGVGARGKMRVSTRRSDMVDLR